MNHTKQHFSEFELIEQIRQWFGDTGQSGPDPAQNFAGLKGIGDDCSVVLRENSRLELVTTDLLIEDTHFLFDRISPEDLGYKSLAVNLSDIAAMGGTPRHFWLSIGITDKTDTPWLERFFTSMRNLAQKYNVRLMGGDTTRSVKSLVINITVFGEAESTNIRLRSGAKPGDIIFVTDVLGNSACGFRLLEKGHLRDKDPAVQRLIRAHNRPRPHIREGIWLGQQPAVHSLIDVSDGIASDAGHIAKSSGAGMDIRLEQVPTSEEMRRVSGLFNWDTLTLACSGGEDYVLLGTCNRDDWKSLRSDYHQTFGQELYTIGTVRDKPDESNFVRFLENDKPSNKIPAGFDHLKNVSRQPV